VKGLDKPDSLQRLHDPREFDNRFDELHELKEAAKESQDPDQEALTANVKKRKLNADGRSQNTTEAENIAPKCKKSGSAKRAAPHVQKKVDQANGFLSFFGLPTNACIEFNALAVVIKKLRGELRSRISNAKKPRGNANDTQLKEMRLRGASHDVAKCLVTYYNHPESSLDHLLALLDANGPECIRQIQQWLGLPDLLELQGEANKTMTSNVHPEFRTSVKNLAQQAEKETRKYLTKSQHRLSCTKVQVDDGSVLLGQYSGPPDYVSSQLKYKDPMKAERVKQQPYLCKDLRSKKGINILAFMSKDDMKFTAMPGPCDAFPEGWIYFGCEICRGKTSKGECNCTTWLEELGIKKYETETFDLDETVVPAHLDNYCFGGRRWGSSQGVLDLRRFTADEDGAGGVQLIGLTKEGI
jgi:hypothetical protein